MRIYRSVFALLMSYGLLLLANGLFGTIVSIRTKTEQFPDSVIGFVLAAYFAGLLISSFTAVKVIARIGHIRAFATFASVASAIALTHLLWVDPLFWGMLRLVSGFCMGGMIVVTEGWLNERATNQNRGTILSLYMITTYACAGSAQLIMMLGHPDGFKLFVIVSILFSFALLPILLSQSQAPTPSQPKRPDVRRLYRVSPVGMTGSFVVGVVNGVFYSFAPVFAYSIGLNVQQTAIFIALGISSGVLLQLPLGKVSDKVDRRWVIVFSSLLTTGACYLMYRVDISNMYSVYLLAIFYGSIAFSINPICAAHTNDLAPVDERVQTSSGLLMFYGVGAVAGPIIGGIIASHYGMNAIFAMSGSIVFVFALYAIYRIIVRPRAQQDKRNFVPYAVQSPAQKLAFSRKRKRAKAE